MIARLGVTATLWVAGCGSEPAPDVAVDGGSSPDAPTADASPLDAGDEAPLEAGMQANGSIAIPHAIAPVAALHAGDAVIEWVEVSAPIFPRVLELYQHEGASYPDSLEAQEALVADVALLFDDLLVACSADYEDIQLGSVLTFEEKVANYDAVARCGYEQHSSKPYWIPQLVLDVGVCEQELGGDWHLPTEFDLASFAPEDFQFLTDTLTAAGGDDVWSAFYFSTRVYVAGPEAGLQMGDLAPDPESRLAPLGLDADAMKHHLENAGRPLGLRCIRRTPP